MLCFAFQCRGFCSLEAEANTVTTRHGVHEWAVKAFNRLLNTDCDAEVATIFALWAARN